MYPTRPLLAFGSENNLWTDESESKTVTIWKGYLVHHHCETNKCYRFAAMFSVERRGCKELSPSWQADSLSHDQEISYLLWNQNVDCHVHKNSSQDCVPNHLNRAQYFMCAYKIHFNNILVCMYVSGLLSWGGLLLISCINVPLSSWFDKK